MRYEGVRSITKLVPDDDTELSTAVYSELGRLLSSWREDPDRLGVAVTAYEGLGYHMADFWLSHGPEYPSEAWGQDGCIEAVCASLRGRPKRLLKAQARGLVMCLVATAQDSRRARLHDVQVQSAVIECRILPTNERAAKLRALDDKGVTP